MGALSRTPLGELTTLPQIPSRLGGGSFSPFPSPRRFWHLNLDVSAGASLLTHASATSMQILDYANNNNNNNNLICIAPVCAKRLQWRYAPPYQKILATPLVPATSLGFTVEPRVKK